MTDPSEGIPSDCDSANLIESLDLCRTIVRNSRGTKVPVRLQMAGFQVVADCDLQGQRITDFLNQKLSDYIECTDAKLFRAGQLVECFANLKVRKPEILIAGIVGHCHEAPEKRIGNRRSLKQFHAVLAVDRWIVKGHLHLTSQKDVQEFLHSNRDFFPVAQASIDDVETAGHQAQVEVAIVNRTRVSLMEITEIKTTNSASLLTMESGTPNDFPIAFH
jgi:hypothetical protein